MKLKNKLSLSQISHKNSLEAPENELENPLNTAAA